jgi:predicted Rossmann-fold nucleotide-binding protein
MNSKALESEASMSGPAMATGQSRRRIVAVFGGTVPDAILALAEELGREIARRGEILLTGGTGPGAADPQTVKNRAIEGTKSSPWIGIDRKAPWNGFSKPPWGFQIESPLGHRRNYLEAWMCDAAIVLKGDTGTKSELGSALALRRRVVLVGESWRDFHAGLRDTPAATRSRLATDTNDKFRNEADPALEYDPAALTTALEQATQPLKCEWRADNATAAAIVDAALVDTPLFVSLTGRFPEALDCTVAANYEAWLGTLGALPLPTGS